MSKKNSKKNKRKDMSLEKLLKLEFRPTTSDKLKPIRRSDLKSIIRETTPEMSEKLDEKVRSVKKDISHYSTDDAGNIDCFMDIFGEYVVYDINKDCFLNWTGRLWLEDDEQRTMRWIQIAMRARREYTFEYLKSNPNLYNYKDLESHAHKCCNMRSIRAVYEGIKCLLAKSDDIFDTHKELLNVLTGVIDLKTGNVESHKRSKHITKLIPIMYDESANSELFDNFLKETFGNDNLINYIQRLCGYCITGETREQLIHFFEGNGANGKSTLLEIIQYVMNDYVEIIPSKVLLHTERRGGATPEVAKLPHKRLVCCSELNCTDILNEGKIKIMSSGETLPARDLFSSAFTFAPEFKCIIDTNYLPRIMGTDNGIWRRVRVVPFKHTVPKDKINPNLLEELKQHRVAILNWLIEGAKAYYKYGLDIESCPEVKKATKKYRSEQDTLSSFIDACIIECENSSVNAREVYDHYIRFCDDNLLIPMSETKFGKDFAVRGNYKRARSSKSRKYLDIKLR